MKAAILYESMFGSPGYVARVVADGLARAGADVRLTDVRTASPDDLAGSDLLLIGAPTHAASPRRLSSAGMGREATQGTARAALGVREWLTLLDRAFPARALRPPAIVFDTRVDASSRPPGPSARRAAKAMLAQGFQLAADPVTFYVQHVGGPPTPAEADRARRWAGMLVEGGAPLLVPRPRAPRAGAASRSGDRA